jgi:Flp pilus assembly protein TadG
MSKMRGSKLLNDEQGGGTVMGLTWFMVLVAICGLAVDTTDGFHSKTALQATADAAALAASIDLPDETLAYGNAMLYADLNMPNAQYGSVLKPQDVDFGAWDPATRQFTQGVAPADAIRVRVHRSRSNGNALASNFLRIIGMDAWDDISAEAIAQRFVPPCLNDGLFARKVVDVSANNDFVERICVHGEEGVNMQNHNYFELGTSVSMPDPDTMLTTPAGGIDSNPGLRDALKANSYNFRMVDDLPNIIAKLLNPDLDTDEVPVVPEYVQGDPKEYDIDYTVEGLNESDLSKMDLAISDDGKLVYDTSSSEFETLSLESEALAVSTGDELYVAPTSYEALNVTGVISDAGEKEIWHIRCKPNETYQIPSNIVLVNIVIVAECVIHVGSGTILNNVVLASTAIGNGSKPLDYQNITFAADVQLGDNDDCAPGGGVQVYSAASVHFSSSMMINGLQVVAAGSVELGARDQAAKGISVQAGENITLTSNNMFGLCSGGTDPTLTKASYRLVK